MSRLIKWAAPCPVCEGPAEWWSYDTLGDAQAGPTVNCPGCFPEVVAPPPSKAVTTPAAIITLRAVARRLGAWQ